MHIVVGVFVLSITVEERNPSECQKSPCKKEKIISVKNPISTTGQTYLNRGLSNAKLGNHREAVEDSSLCLKYAHNYPKALYRRACSFRELKEFGRALMDAKLFCGVEDKATKQKLGPQ